jgi:hypothetical protein
VTNLATQRLLLDLQAATADSSSGGSSAAGWLRAAGSRLLQTAARIKRAAHQQQQQQPPQQQPGLLLQFAVPATAILQLHLQQGGLPQAATLVLLSDFAKTVAPVQLQPQIVWLLALDSSLSAPIFEQLQPAGPSPPAEQQQQQQQQWWLPAWPNQAAAPLRGLAAAAGSGGAAGSGRLSSALPWPSRQASGSIKASGSIAAANGAVPASSTAEVLPPPLQPPPQEPHQSMLGRMGQQYAQPAAQRLRALQQQLAARVGGAGKQQEVLPAAALLLGQLLLDATPVFTGSGSIVQQLELAAEAITWKAGQQQHDSYTTSTASTTAATAAGAEEDEAALHEGEAWEAADDDLAEVGHLSLAARLRRQVAQAGSAARRRALLLRRRRQQRGALAALPPPDLLLLVLHQRQLQSASYGEGLDAAVLAAVRRLAAACRTCNGGVPLLLAAASPTVLSTPYRRQLAYSSGLADSSSWDSGGSSQRGTVVPLPWQAAAASNRDVASAGILQARALQAALHMYGAARLQRQESMQQQRAAVQAEQEPAGWLRAKL